MARTDNTHNVAVETPREDTAGRRDPNPPSDTEGSPEAAEAEPAAEGAPEQLQPEGR